MTIKSRQRGRAAVLIAMMAMPFAEAGAATNTWTGLAGDYQWYSPGNWSLGHAPSNPFPACCEMAVIGGTPGLFSVLVSQLPGPGEGPYSIDSQQTIVLQPSSEIFPAGLSTFRSGVQLKGGTLAAGGDIYGSSILSGGILAGAVGANLNFQTGSKTAIDGSISIRGKVVSNYGSFEQIGSGQTDLYYGAVFVNKVGAQFNLKNDGDIRSVASNPFNPPYNLGNAFINEAGASFTKSNGLSGRRPKQRRVLRTLCDEGAFNLDAGPVRAAGRGLLGHTSAA